MKKKFTLLLAGVLAVSSFSIGALSKGIVEKIEAELRPDFSVVVDGVRQNFRDVNGNRVEPILYNGTTYLPVRAVGELMGKTVYWYQDEKRIELVGPSKEESLVTDADVIVESAEKKKEDKKQQVEKKDKVDNTEVKITLEEAKKIVLEKALLKEDGVVFTKSKLDYDDGLLIYEIDFKTDTDRYDAEVDAKTGEITQWEIEAKKEIKKDDAVADNKQITLEEAKKIALKKAGLKQADVIFEEAKLDSDDRKAVYDIEFRHGKVEYSFEIDVANGKIIEWEKDND